MDAWRVIGVDPMPTIGRFVLVYIGEALWSCSNGDDPRRQVAWWDGERWKDFGPGLGGDVTHWAPLPGPPDYERKPRPEPTEAFKR